MMLHASRSRKLRASFAAIGSVAVVAASAAAAAPAVFTEPPAAQEHCHDMGHDAPAAAPVAPAAVPEPAVATTEEKVEGARGAFSERFPNLVLKTHEGKTVRFYDDLLAGKIVMINFMYADCKGR